MSDDLYAGAWRATAHLGMRAQCSRAWADYRSERAELAGKWRRTGWHYIRAVLLANVITGIVWAWSPQAAQTMAWFYLGWFGPLGLWLLWSGATGMGWFHRHTGYVSEGGWVRGCGVCGRPPAECASSAGSPD
jgi:hypothetical protein